MEQSDSRVVFPTQSNSPITLVALTFRLRSERQVPGDIEHGAKETMEMLTQRLSGLQPPCEELGEIFSCSITSLASDLAAAGLALMETAAHERPLSPQIDRPRFRARFVFRQAGISTAVAKPDEASGLMTLCTKSFWRVRGVLVPNEEMGCRSLILVLDTRVTAQNNKGKPAKLPRAPGVSRGQPRERIRPTMDIRFSDRRLHIIPSAKR